MHGVLKNYLDSQSLTETKLSVWSLVVTIFGDAIAPRGGVLRLGALQQITDHIGISNNALRTAMSRLASDGWLERKRIGRASFYSPSNMAVIENKEASQTIYRFFPRKWNNKWLFVISNEPEGFNPAIRAKLHFSDFAFKNRKLAIAPDYRTSGNDGLDISIKGISVFEARSLGINNIDDILSGLNFHHDCNDLYHQFVHSAANLSDELKTSIDLSNLDALLLRLLLLHQWRRVVLRDVRWPAQLRPLDWPGFAAQKLVGELYSQLLEPSEAWLSQLHATPDGCLPPAKNALTQRFHL